MRLRVRLQNERTIEMGSSPTYVDKSLLIHLPVFMEEALHLDVVHVSATAAALMWKVSKPEPLMRR